MFKDENKLVSFLPLTDTTVVTVEICFVLEVTLYHVSCLHGWSVEVVMPSDRGVPQDNSFWPSICQRETFISCVPEVAVG